MEHEALIIGGGFAGLSAATVLARARRRVLVVDAGAPRNRFSSHAHNVIGHDGRSGAEILADARAQFLRYDTAELMQGEVASLTSEGEGFSATLQDGRVACARKLVLATGVADRLPNIAGAAERWGKTVLHCPYCHGYEIGAGRRIGVLGVNEHSARYAALIADWGETVFFPGRLSLADEQIELLHRRDLAIIPTPIEAIEGEAPAIDALRLADGRRISVDALFVGSNVTMASPLAEALGCAIDETPMGPIIRTDGQKRTTVPGVYAAGDAARQPHSVAFAAADGMMAGLGAHHDLIGL
ncbi:MAG TPA: NAD(P)/FAD-dependent oxidoreductase [Vitreimonas sp.]|uniref:NAD(P)/FAD-dependent oxidoreductase n=1 Tax=Vitreimonas sp. TaxID=3069702 RepID=UPI002D6F1D40|nr:NAD(P)/FAD-dependent oxidoreductase [Vitreimonas sp.]HYD86367.1 NAD(P)/FAD-dependent oxidoreductase [Vitreimonas sp.]